MAVIERADRPTEETDEALAERAAGGERRAFEQLLRRHYDRMHRIAWRLAGRPDDADDIVQEVCCLLVDRIASFRGEARFSTWLYGVVVNAAHDHGRRRASQSRVKTALSSLTACLRPPDGRDLYRRTHLAGALDRLDPALRSTIVLVVGEGLTHAEAGAALGIAEATVSWRIHEARKRLGDLYGHGDT